MNFYDFDPPSENLKLILLEECVSSEANSKRKKNRVSRAKTPSKELDDQATEQAKEVPNVQALESAKGDSLKKREHEEENKQTNCKKIKKYVDKQTEDSVKMMI